MLKIMNKTAGQGEVYGGGEIISGVSALCHLWSRFCFF